MITWVVLAASPAVVVAAFTVVIGRLLVDSVFDGDATAAEDDNDAAAAPSMDMEVEEGHANATKASKC